MRMNCQDPWGTPPGLERRTALKEQKTPMRVEERTGIDTQTWSYHGSCFQLHSLQSLIQERCFGNICTIRRLGRGKFKVRVLWGLPSYENEFELFVAFLNVTRSRNSQGITSNIVLQRLQALQWKNQQLNKDLYFGFKYLEWQLKHTNK